MTTPCCVHVENIAVLEDEICLSTPHPTPSTSLSDAEEEFTIVPATPKPSPSTSLSDAEAELTIVPATQPSPSTSLSDAEAELTIVPATQPSPSTSLSDAEAELTTVPATPKPSPSTSLSDAEAELTIAAAQPSVLTTLKDGEVELRIGDSETSAEKPLTIHDMFMLSLERYGDQPALSLKVERKWTDVDYREYYLICRQAARSFLKLGLQRFHGVCILGYNSPEWFIANIGAILAGGCAVGIYTTNSAEACQYVAEHCEANIIVVENKRQLHKILQVEDQLPHLKAIIYYRGEVKEKRSNLYTWAEFLLLGRDEPEEPLDAIISSQKPNQCCTLIYTSGTTGQPKGVMLSHDNITWTALSISRHANLKEPPQAQEVVVSYLPLSHIAAQMIDIWIIMKVGGKTCFAQPDALKGSLVNTMKEVNPTAFMGVPRVWEKMQEKMRNVGEQSPMILRRVAAWAKRVGLEANLTRMNPNGEAGRKPISFHLAKFLVFKKIRKALGLERSRLCFTSAAPISKDTLEFFLSLNIPLYEIYGMSESTGPHTVSLPGIFKLTSCGKEIPGCKTKLHNPDENGIGEICLWGRHVFMGYLNMPEKTEETLDAEGWLHSGDLGKHDNDGFIYITGRIKEMIITAGGENVPPVPIEDAVKEALPLISNAMLVGDNRKFLSLLITLKTQVNTETGDPEDELTPEALEICRKLGSNATRVSQIIGGRDKFIHDAITVGIKQVNEKATSNAQKVQRWVILAEDFSISRGELGPTMKLKRSVVLENYKDLIDKLYLEP
ncbi:long-chain-fatty-acid--CoA ligase ACSBG2-like [Antennarius striatus]|uniref:long-chain-fatty-acid--CoA ligase ACSBG2-like n=1 Tax=Antennarius striatus TaxID=241820 RepID=UPI0035B2F6B3